MSIIPTKPGSGHLNAQGAQFLELFSGSGQISEVFKQYGFNTTTVDNNRKLNPNICVDILNTRRTVFPSSVFLIWASIPCTTFSIQSISHHFEKIEIGYRRYYYIPKTEKAELSLKIVSKTLELIRKINPKYYIIENPRGGMRHLPNFDFCPHRHTVSYADYGFEVYKPTDLFTDIPGLKLEKLRTAVGRKFNMKISDMKGNYERSKVPPDLIHSIINQLIVLDKQSFE